MAPPTDDPRPAARKLPDFSTLAIIAGCVLPLIAVFVWSWWSVEGAAKDAFVKQFSCPEIRVTATRRKDIQAKDLAPPYVAPPPPASVASDPGRLAVWKANHPSPAVDDSLQVIELQGCGHHMLWACRQGKKLLLCDYKRSLPPAAAQPAYGGPTVDAPAVNPAEGAEGGP